jgi:hypothetical protein
MSTKLIYSNKNYLDMGKALICWLNPAARKKIFTVEFIHVRYRAVSNATTLEDIRKAQIAGSALKKFSELGIYNTIFADTAQEVGMGLRQKCGHPIFQILLSTTPIPLLPSP